MYWIPNYIFRSKVFVCLFIDHLWLKISPRDKVKVNSNEVFSSHGDVLPTCTPSDTFPGSHLQVTADCPWMVFVFQ